MIVPSASLLLMLGVLGLSSLARSCGVNLHPQESASVENGGFVKDYVPPPAAPTAESDPPGAAKKP
jgi:hypothetical protein